MLTLLPVASLAQSTDDLVTQSVVAQLTDQGFTDFSVSRTLLGRIRVVATNSTHKREIVVNPSNGAILRDVYTELADGSVTPRLIDRSDEDDRNSGSGGGSGGNSSGSSSGGGNDDDDDDDDDDKDDDDDDDDENDD